MPNEWEIRPMKGQGEVNSGDNVGCGENEGSER